MLSLQELRESLKTAEYLASLSLTSRQDRQEGRGGKPGKEFERHEEEEEGRKGTRKPSDAVPYVPPKQLLLYLVRMGSFTSKPKLESEAGQDESVKVPEDVVGRQDLLAWLRTPIAHLPAPLPRAYRPRPGTVTPAHAATGDRPPSSAESFRVMQWNILAQALGTHADNFVKCPSEALEWNTRRFRILEEIITYNPHIICLQEVDHYDLLERVLATQGYKGVFMPKPESPCLYLPSNNGPDGCALFWDTARFSLVAKETRVVEVWHVQSNQVAILLILEDETTGREIAVLTTHLKARQGALLSTLRDEQGKDLLGFMDLHCGNRPTIVSGDFNAEPTEPVYSTMTHESTGLKSAYAFLNEGKEPAYSTWKVREEGDICHNIDYIFYTPNSLTPEGGIDVPTEKDLGPGRAPSLAYPSDHFSLICDFSLKPNNRSNFSDMVDKPVERDSDI
ncbi:nocturnin-like isoform X1 [Penaeus indicus]|uniref:nocturnin-like isoform X1 n=2 Tax=Penaeus indicus TaxID=29960 RepID=UPI00300C5548